MQPDKRFVGEFDLSLIPTLDEFDRRYQDTYMLVDIPSVGTGEDVYLYKGSGGGSRCYFMNDLHGEIIINQESECKVKAFFPPVGLFNDEKKSKAYVLYKYPARMNRRSICDKNAKIFDPVLFRYSLKPPKFSFDLLRQALARNHVNNLSTAIGMLMAPGAYSVALNDTYMVSNGNKKENYFLWFRDLPVGIIVEGGREVKIDGHYYQEFRDYLVGSNQSKFYKLTVLQ